MHTGIKYRITMRAGFFLSKIFFAVDIFQGLSTGIAAINVFMLPI